MISGFGACFLALQTAIRCSQDSFVHSQDSKSASSEASYSSTCFNARIEPPVNCFNAPGYINTSVYGNYCDRVRFQNISSFNMGGQQ